MSLKLTASTFIFLTQIDIQFISCLNEMRQNRNTTPEIPPRILRAAQHQKGLKVKSAAKKPDTYYEPYWDEGAWVFHRHKHSTVHPTAHMIGQGKTPHRECNQVCIQLYLDYGKVCGVRLKETGGPNNVYRYHYWTFDNMCLLEYENCYKNNRPGWVPMNKGPCTQYGHFTTHPTIGRPILDRVTRWLGRLNTKRRRSNN